MKVACDDKTVYDCTQCNIVFKKAFLTREPSIRTLITSTGYASTQLIAEITVEHY